MASDTWCQRLNGTDATFLYLEDANAHMHVGGVFVYEGPPPTYRELSTYVTSRLDQVPRYRQRLAFVPLGLARPVWIDDPELDIENHVLHCALPAPGEMEELKRYAGRVFGEPLPRDKPMWSLELVEGLAGGRFAVLSKTHHCVLDGIAGNSVIGAVTDATPDVQLPAAVPGFSPRPAPSRLSLLASALRDQVARPFQLAREALRPATEGRRMLRDLVEGARPLAALAARGRAPASSLNRPIGSRRRYELFSVDLGAIKRVRAAFGGTINDVLLAMVAGALRRLLASRGETLRDDLRVFVPVNARPPDATTGDLGNQVVVVYCPLPLTERDPVARLHRIRDAMNALKKSKEALATASVAHLGELSMPPLAAAASRLEVAYRRFNLVVSNVAGFPTTRYLLGRKLLSFHPLIPLANGSTLSVGLHGYAGAIHFGLLGDAGQARDLALFARAIPDALSELLAAAQAPEIAATLAHGAALPPPPEVLVPPAAQPAKPTVTVR